MSTSLGIVRLHGASFDVAAMSEVGPRSENQDAYAVDAFPTTGLLLVADGMGGQKAGRFAADTALRTVLGAAPIRSLDAARYAIRAADEAVTRAARENPGERDQMGCALALLCAVPDRAGQLGWVGAHVGDVRILSRAPDGTMRLETRDHSLAFSRWEAGEVALDEIPDTPGANRLVRAVGHGGEADTTWIPLRAGWSYLLVSDGITKAMRLDELGETLTLPTMADTVAAIARKVEERGPDDNYTAVAVRVLGDAAPAAAFDRDPDVTREHPPVSPRTPATAPVPREAPVAAPGRSSSLGGVALLLSALALGAAGFAWWTAQQAAGSSAVETRVDSLQRQVDSLRALVAPAQLDGVTAAGDTAAPAPSATTPVPVPSPPTSTNPR